MEKEKVIDFEAERKSIEKKISDLKTELTDLKMRELKKELLDFQKGMKKEKHSNCDTVVLGEYRIMKKIVELWEIKVN